MEASDSSWSVDQDLKLQHGLKSFGKDDSDRWIKIAEGVHGKTKKECVRRFKELATAIRGKQQAAAVVQSPDRSLRAAADEEEELHGGYSAAQYEAMQKGKWFT